MNKTKRKKSRVKVTVINLTEAQCKQHFDAGVQEGRKQMSASINLQVLEAKLKVINSIGQTIQQLAHVIGEDGLNTLNKR